jgi:TatD DNase family protein
LIDSHVHLTVKKYRKDLQAVLARAREAGLAAMVNVGFDIDSSADGVRLAEQHADIYAAVGVHPHDADTVDDYILSYLGDLSANPKVVAIGEIGLDFYRDLSPRRVQEEVFVEQLALADKVGLPVVIHDRDAHRRVIDILRGERASRGVMHCFSGDFNLARQALDLGFYISFAGPITYDGVKAAEIIKKAPQDRILVETDCPYLPPVPFRGKRNEPAYVRYVLARVAEILGKTLEETESLTDANTRRLFNLASRPC